MKSILLASLLSAAVASGQGSAPSLTFEDAVGLVAKNSPAPKISSDIGGLRSRLPNVRIETTGNTSRTLDFFSDGPFEARYASTVLAFDVPLWDGRASDARISAVASRLRRIAARDRVDDARYAQLLDAFSDLYLAQKESDSVAALSELFSEQESTTERLRTAGEISNLAAAERTEITLALRMRLLEIQARRIDAAAKLRLLTGVEAEPKVALDLSQPSAAQVTSAGITDDSVQAATVAVDASRERVREMAMLSGFRATLSGFGGYGGASSRFRDSTSRGSFGVYGLRVNLSYPLFRGRGGVEDVEARAGLAEAEALRDSAIETARLREAEYRMREETARRRIAVLEESINVAKLREESLQRLVKAGMRSESDLDHARSERVRREGDLLAVRVERWKAAQLLTRMMKPESPNIP